MLRSVFRLAPALLLGLALTACHGDAEHASANKEAPTETKAETVATSEPWTEKELLPPAELARMINAGEKPVVFAMGPAGVIKGATEIGPAEDEENLAKLRTALANVPKDQQVVVYCGCCPFEPCPNIRPAVRTVKAAGFANVRLLNLAHNLKADWIDQGYPMAE